MSRLVHLSDLHFGAADRLQPRIHDGLIETLATERGRADLLVLTGDVFDSSSPGAELVGGFITLLTRMYRALGGPVPTLLLPGNHDRREIGVFAPWSGALFQSLGQRLAELPQVQVLGNRTPFLGERVQVEGLPADVVAYDSSYLPRGLVSAGGQIRQEDLIQLGAELGGSTRPLLFLLHHHLIPTPVTDTSIIATAGRPVWQRLLVRELLPNLVGNGDREELTMTALGAGSALTTLQTLGRAVVVLHGHKHYPTARLLKGFGEDADLLLTSAGSCGKAQDWSEGDWDEAPRLWPSINLIELSDGHIEVKSQAWSPLDPTRRNTPRLLASAKRVGLRWELDAPPEPRAFEPVFALNAAEISLRTSTQFLDRLDLHVQRTLEATPAAYMPEYWDTVEGPKGARVTELVSGGVNQPDAACPRRVRIPLRGQASWRVLGGVHASIAAASATWGAGSCFESVELLIRSRTALARLSVHLGPVTTRPFASVTDLTNGKERPVPFKREGDLVTLEYANCPARALLRLYWPLS